MKWFPRVALVVVLSLGCDRSSVDGPVVQSVAPAAAPAEAAPAEAAPEPAAAAPQTPSAPLVLESDQFPARDRRDAAVRRSLDPGDCPAGTRVDGRAPPAGIEQFCARSDGVRFGPARVWPKDALPSSGGYVPGKNFRPISAAGYHDGKPHGPEIVWWPSGSRQTLRQYNVGVPIGIWASWDEEGRMLSQRNYFQREAPPPPELLGQNAGEPWGYGSAYLYTEFFEDGTKSRQRIRLDDEHELVAGSRTWFKNGQLKCQADQRPERAAGHLHWVCWYENGQKREEGGLREGVRHGEWTEWAKNGSLRVHGTYFLGKKTGSWEKTNARGKKKTQSYPVPIAQTLDPLPKAWTEVFKADNTVVLRPDCDGLSRSITITGEHLIVAAGGESRSHGIEKVSHEDDTYAFGLADKQSIAVLYKGEGTAAIWKRPSKQLAAIAGIYVPTSMVGKLKAEPATGCPKAGATK